MNIVDARGLCNLLEQLGLELCEIICEFFNEEMPEYQWTINKHSDGGWHFWADPRHPTTQTGPARIAATKH